MSGFFSRLFKGRSAPPWEPPRPETPVQVVGDVHGRADLLEKLLGQLDPSLPLVLVGDLVDRGDHSADVLDLARALPDRWQAEALTLMGNHEEMLLRFLEEPGQGGSWLRYGGLQTLASFGVAVQSTGSEAALTAARDQLADGLGADRAAWLKALPMQWQSGDVHVAHAGADPAEDMEMQSRRTLLWGHSDFASVPRTDGQWVCHGHTIVDAPLAEHGRISVDTGAYATGRLTAAVIHPDEPVRFVTT